MEIKECCEVPIYSTAKVSPGDYYDHETRDFSQALDLEHIKIEKVVLFKLETCKKGFIEHLKTNEVLSQSMWVIDYDKETPVDAILIKGKKCFEERYLEVPEENERCRVLSVFYSYPANLLLCFNEEIPGDVFKTFEGHLHSMCSQPPPYSVVFSKSLTDKFVCGYIYPIYSEPGKRFDKFIYGVNEFFSVLREATVSTLPTSALVDKPKNRYSGRVRDSVSDGFKTNIKSESNGNQHIDNDCIVSQSESSDLFRDHAHVDISHPNKVFRQEVDFYQSNVVEQNKGQVVREETFDPCNSGSTLTMSEDCNKKLHEDNVNKSKRGSASYSEFPEDSNDKPAFYTKEETQPANKFLGGDIKKSEYHTKSQDTNLNHSSESRVTMKESSLKNSGLKQNCNSTIYKTAEPSNKLPRSDIKKSEDDNRKSQVTKEKDTSESKGTIKENSSKKSTRSQNCNSTISANAKKEMGHNEETKKSKKSEKKVDPNIDSRVETNNVRPKKLIQGLRNEDQDEKSYLKIGNQDNYKVKTCKEKPQMKSTFLEADKTADDMLGFQRKYYGVVNDTSLEKVILLLGAPGSGKTTLVNLAANYFKEKKSADEELYHVVTSSPTSEITAYTFCSAPDEINITIIDTPGLNDSSGAEVRDHIQSLKTFLANASASEFQIHAIGFVAQAYLVRLTSSERLVMDYVSTIFGQGVKDHLITLVTFADNQDNPPVVEAMKNYGVSIKLSLKFNNSALHNNKAEEVDDIDRVYWRICWRNWKKCMKTLRDLSPLSVSTMKAVHSEVFASTILKSTERDLTGNLKTFFGYSKENRISSKEARKVCVEIWNLAAVLQHFRSLNDGLHNSREDILIEFAAEICKAKQIFDKENICFLSLNPDTPLIISGLQVIRTMESLYKQSKSLHTKTNTLSKNVTEWTHCHNCNDVHKMERLSRGILKKLTGSDKDEVALRCIECRCPGEVHGVSETRSPFHPDIVIEKNIY
ncbi:uncharacterized protein [Palaemon carinicauda]|uniref:uncharacterized protein n=1 Tax=Palaemon carinicauda TaxID=392227 RepID=UPI0035B57141